MIRIQTEKEVITIHKYIPVNQNDEKVHIRPYLKLKSKRYGMSDKETDELIKYDDKRKKVSVDGMDVNYPYENIDSKTYFKKSDLDSLWNDYVKLSGKTLSDEQRYKENADYISDEYRKLNDHFKSDPFSTEYALNIYKRYTDIGNKTAGDSVSGSRVANQGSVDTTALADAKKIQMDFKDRAYEKIADYSLKKADTGIKILESFSKENQKFFENDQTDKTTEMNIIKTKSDISGEIPDEIRDDNPYINPDTGNVYDVELDYQQKIDSLKEEMKNVSDEDEKARLIKKYNNLIDARYAKIINNDEFMKYMDQGDITSQYKNYTNLKDQRENDTRIKESIIDSDTEKYKTDKSLESDKYTQDKKAESDMYIADKDLEGQKYTSLNKLKEKALDGLMQSEILEDKKEERQAEEREKERERAEEQDYDFGLPVTTSSYRVSSKFGPRNTGIEGASTYHKAVDLACDYGENVVSSKDGVVTFAGWVDGYGNTVEIQHNDDIVTKYHHMAELPKVKKGDRVTKGQVIGIVGSTGISSGNHLDFQIYKNGEAVDPELYLNF